MNWKGKVSRGFWIKQQPENCCYASFKAATGIRVLCRKPATCLFCSAKHFEEKDRQDGLFPRHTVAAVSLLSKKYSWLELPTNKIFDFIYELDQRLTGHADLKKELSYYGAIRCNPQEVRTALDEESLLGYYVEVTHNKNGVAFCRVSMDPMNRVYAGWLVAIAGTARSNIWSNKREKLGYMAETALGLLKLIDENVRSLGRLVGDPNSMSNRIEQSLRIFLESDSQRFFTFGKGRPAKGKRQPRREEYQQEIADEIDEMASAVITIEDVLGPFQTRKSFSDKETADKVPADTDVVMISASDEEGPQGDNVLANNATAERHC